eukprot:XP_011681764.1 PREDICTED: uncharacterized protein LOC105446516 [Strongylocentrotus purpuratus]
MNSNSRNWRPELCHIVSEVQLVISITLEMIQNITILRTNLGRSKVAAPLISTSSRLDELFFLVIDNSADQKVRKSMNFLSLGMKGYTNIRCKGLQGSKRLHSTGLLRSKVLNSVGLRQLSRESHIEGLQTSRTLHSVGPRKSDGSHSYRSESQPRPNTFNSAGQPTPDNSYSYRTKSLHRSKTVQDKILQTSEELYCHSFNDSPHPPFEGTQGSTSVLQTAIQALILQTSMVLKIARQYCHVVILMVILTQAACTVQVPINCMNAFVITSRNYPSTYPQFENVEWSVTAPEGRMILLTFNNFSLGPLGDITVIDTVDDGERQRYSGEENTISPFLSRRNTLLLRFRSDGTPTGNGFNISASCYDLSGIRVGRLTGGHTRAEGFLELQAESGGEWTRVCEEHSADRVAEVVCGELGFPGAKEVSYEQGWCSSERTGPVCIRAHSCENSKELGLEIVPFSSVCYSASSNECISSKAVKVKCFEPGFKGCYDLDNIQPQDGSSYDSISKCITSCRADTYHAIAIINGNKCLCSTSDDIGLSSFSKIEARSCGPHQLVYNASVGFCVELDDVFHGSWDSNITWFGSIVHLICDDGYRLNGSGTLQCVREVSSYLPVWNGSTPTCEMITNPSYPMTSGQGNTAIAISPPMTPLLTAFLTALLICIICAAVWKCRKRKIHKQRAATRESDLTNSTRALPQPPIEESLPTILLNRSQHVTRTPLILNNSPTLHPSLELTALQHGNNNYASGNPYHYAISMTNSPQATLNMGTDVNAYEPEDMTDQNTINAGHRTEMMPMLNRPLPHRPISVGVREGPSLPPRERRGIHSSTLSPNLTQNTRSDNTYYSADDFKHDDVHNGSNFPLSPLPFKLNPFYHCLEDDDQQMCSKDCDTDVLIYNESNAHDDNLAEVMVDNVLYNPMEF